MSVCRRRRSHRLARISVIAGLSFGSIIFLFAATTAHGQQQPAPESAPPAPPTAPADDELITLTFEENSELRVLIAYVGERLGIQFLYDTESVGQQRFTIKPGAKIPRGSLLQFLDLILQTKGFALAEMDQPGWRRIVPNAVITTAARPTTRPLAEDAAGVVTQVFELQVMDASRMEMIIKPFLSQPGGSVTGIPEQRLVVVTDYASEMQRVEKLVRMLDQQTREVVVEFVPLQHADAEELAGKIAMIMQATINTQGVANPAQIGMVEIGFDQRTNQLALVGPKERVAEAIRVVKQFDVPMALVTESYQFEYASPERVDKMMRQMLDPAAARRSYQAAVDKESRLLIVSGTPEIHRRIATIKKSIDVPLETTDSPIQFYKLSNAKAADVLETIRGIQGEEGGDSGGSLRDEPDVGRANPLAGRRGAGGGYGSAGGGRLGRNMSGMGPNSEDGPAAAAARNPGAGGDIDNDPSPAANAAGGTGAPLSANGAGGTLTMPGLRSADGAGDAAGPTTFQTPEAIVTADPNTNSIFVVADPALQKMYEQLIRMLDKRRPQVMIECTIVTLDTSRDFRLGVDVGIRGSSGEADIITFSSFGVSRPRTNNGSPTGRLAIAPGNAGFNGALLSSDIADVVVNALLTSGRARVVSAPRILVNDNATGSLLSTAEQPYTSLNIGDTTSTTSFGGYVEAGTSIDLTPHISEADYLQLEYQVSLNSFSGQSEDGIPPPRQTSALASIVTIPDGSTIIIGGLNATNQNETIDAVPILGQIPLLEYLFSARTDQNIQQTLFVFIRPVILRDDQFQDLKYLSDRDSRLAGLSPDEPDSEPMTVK